MKKYWQCRAAVLLAVVMVCSGIPVDFSLKVSAAEVPESAESRILISNVEEGTTEDSRNVLSTEVQVDTAKSNPQRAITEMRLADETEMKDVKAVPGYSSIKVQFTPLSDSQTYKILRSEQENGIYAQIGTTASGEYVDKTGPDKSYYYKVTTSDGSLESTAVYSKEKTGTLAMKNNALLYMDVHAETFDGNKVIDVSDKAAQVGALGKGSVVFRFRTTDKSQHLAVLMGKTAGETVNIYGAGNKAAFMLEKSGESMRVRADFQHTRASATSNYADGEWHTAAIMEDTGAADTFRITIDGVQQNKYDNLSTAGFFSTVKNLNQLTIGGFCNGTSGAVVNGFKGQIGYVLVTDEVLSTADAGNLTNSENGNLCNIAAQMFDQTTENTWVFSGGADVAGGYSETQGMRNYVGQFEEYIRWTKSNNNIPGKQRYMINTGKPGNALSNVVSGFEKLVKSYDPKALSVLVGKEDYSAGDQEIAVFKETLTDLTAKAMNLRNGTGYLVIQTPFAQAAEEDNTKAAKYAEAVKDFYSTLSDEQKVRVMVVDHYKLTNTEGFKSHCIDADGNLNAYGHLEIAKEFAKEVYGSNDGFPVSDASFNLVRTKTASEYLKTAPQAAVENGKLTISIPPSVQSKAAEWNYSLEIKGQTITGKFADKTAVIDGLETDADYTLTVTSADGIIRLSVLTGKAAAGNVPQIKPDNQTELSAQQQKIKEIVDGDKPATWLFVGDSITHGALHTNGYDSIHQTFEKFVRGDLGRVDDVVINTAVSGSTTIEQEANSNARLDKYDADVVIVMLGTNDATAAGDTLEVYQRNLESIVDKINAKGAIPVLRTPNPLRGTDARAVNLPKYAAVIRKVAEEKGVILVDHFAEWEAVQKTKTYIWQNGYWNNDAIHPNAEGQLNMSQSLISGMGLFNEASQICNLSYELPHTSETSTLITKLTQDNGAVAADISALEAAYGEAFGTYSLEAAADGRIYKVVGRAGQGSLSLNNLPKGKTYQITVKAELRDSSKAVSFQTQSITLPLPAAVFEVKFLGKDGQTLKTMSVEKGKAAEAPAAPLVEGYEFKGWDQEFTNVQGNMVINAVYEKVAVIKTKVTISQILLKGLVNNQKIYDGKAVELAGEPDYGDSGYDGRDLKVEYRKAAGQSFTGAPKDAGSYKLILTIPESNPDYEGSTALGFTIQKKELMIKGTDVTIYLNQKTPSSYAYLVTGLIDGEKLIKEPVFRTSAPVNTGKTGLYQIVGSQAAATDNYTISYQNGKLTVAALNYPISYTLNKGKNPSGTPAVYTQGKGIKLPAPVRKNYIFKGWFEKNGKRPVTVIGVKDQGNKNYSAKWEAKPKAVTIQRIKAESKKSFRVTFKGNKTCAGFKVEYSTSKKFTKRTTKYKLVSNSRKRSSNTLTVSGLKKGVKYYVRICGYSKDYRNRSVYGSVGKEKPVQMKK